AGLIAAGLTVVALQLVLTGAEVKQDLDGRLRANQAARQTLAVIADGGMSRSGPVGTDGSRQVHGTRGRAGPPTTTLDSGEVLRLDSNGLNVLGDRNSPVLLTCVGAGDPLPACAAAGATIQLQGSLAARPAFNDAERSVDGRTVEVEILVRDPWSAARGHGRTERYGGIHIYNARKGEGAAGAASDTIGGGG
ncbi:MAG: hypothetical protein RIM80_13415, partial [Alphaproteobacteria bacterium]